ncbi:MAG: hypothetical protein JWN86_4291 [Planctomycetota bacterium]|nr:hypothetical protein [Planctomycetota bacterium]
MESSRPLSHVGSGSARRALKLGGKIRVRKSRKVSGARLIEALEDRRLMTIYSPTGTTLASPVEGIAFSGAITATFVSPSAAGNLSATIDWGAAANPSSSVGTVTPIGTVFVPGFGNLPQYSVTGGTTYGEETNGASLPISVTIHDAADGTDGIATGSTTVSDAPLSTVATAGFSGSEGTALGVTTVARFSDGNVTAPVGDFTATINWGDGTAVDSNVSITSAGGGTFNVLGNHTYTQKGTYTVTANITDEGGSAIQLTNTATIHDVALTDALVGGGLSRSRGTAITNGTTAAFTDDNTASLASDFAAVINWGDGFTSGGVVTKVGVNLFAVTGNHTYTNAGVFPVTTTVTDIGGVLPAGDVLTTFVSNISATIVQSTISAQGMNLSATEATAIPAGTTIASFLDTGGAGPVGNYSATVDFGDGTAPVAATVVAAGSGFEVRTAADQTYAEEGAYGTKVTITNNQAPGTTSFASGSALVADAALTLISTNPIIAPTEGSPLVGFPLALFSDANTAATAAEYSGTIDWGDGSPITSASFSSVGGGAFLVTGTHTYTSTQSSGSEITITVKDTVGGQGFTGKTNPITINDAPLGTGTGIIVHGTEGQPVVGAPVATFIDGNPFGQASDFSATIDWGDGSPLDSGSVTFVGGTATGSTFAITGSHTYASVNAAFPITVVVTDKGGAAPLVINTTANIAQTPIAVNVLPLVVNAASPTPADKIVGSFSDLGGIDAPGQYTVTVDWGDGTSNTLATGVGLIPAGGQTLDITAPSHTYAKPGLYAITITVNDLDPAIGIGGGVAFVGAPALSAVAAAGGPITTAVEGIPLPASTQVASFTVQDPAAVASSFTAQLDWGDGTPQSAGTITLVSSNATSTTFSVTGAHTYAEESLAGHSVQVRIADAFNNVVTAATIVSEVADAPLSSGISVPVSASENQPLNNVPVATFIDSNPNATSADFTASINWGDGTPIDANTRVVLVGGTPVGAIFAVFGSHTYTNVGSFPVSVDIADKGGSAISVIPIVGTATVAQSPLSVNVLPATAVAGLTTPTGKILATFIDQGGADPLVDYTATIDWGDGTSTDVVTIAPLGGGAFSVASPTGHSYAKPGLYVLTVTVNDADPAVGIGANLVTVTSGAMTLFPAPAPPVGAFEGIPLVGVTVATFTDTNLDSLPSEFLAQIDWGDGSPMSLGTITQPGGPGTVFLVTGNHTYVEETLPLQPLTITVVLTDTFGGLTVNESIVTIVQTLVLPVEDAPLSGGTAIPVFGSEHQPLNNVPLATFIDANPGATAADFTASILWGDGSPVDTNAIVTLVGGSAAGSIFAVSGSHIFATPGSFTIGVNVADKGGSSIAVAPVTPTATIAQSPLSVNALPFTATAGVPTAASKIVATFLDAGGADLLVTYTATIDWGDGEPTSVGTIASLGGNSFAVTAPAHIYAKPGAFALTITVNDLDPTSAIGGTLVVVSAGSLTASAAPGGPITTAVEGAPLTGVAVATFTSSDPTALASGFAATIDWGDGSSSSAGIISQPGGIGTPFVVRGNHTYAEETAAGYTISVKIVDTFGNSSNAATVVSSVAEAALLSGTPIPIASAESQPLNNVPVATFVDANPGATSADFTATINWGDGSPATAGHVSLVGGSAAGAIFSVSGSHIYTTSGNFAVTVTVADKGLASITVTPIATISQSPLSVTVYPVVATPGTPTAANKLVASFVDAGGADLLVDYSASIDWGDGSAPDTGVIADLGGGAFSVSAPSHTYTKPGAYQVKVTVIDSDPATGIGINLALVSAATLTASSAPGGPITTAVEGAPLTAVTVGTFTSSNPLAVPSDFNAAIDWGDGSPRSAGTITQPGGIGTAFVIQGNHTYAEEGGLLTISVAIYDGNGGHAGTTTLVTGVADAALLNGTAIAVSGAEGHALGAVPVASFIDANSNATAADFTATIDWGDGSPATIGLVSLVGGTPAGALFVVTGHHTYTSVNSAFPVVVNVSDKGGATLPTINSTANITQGPVTVTVLGTTATVGVPTAAGKIVATFLDGGGADALGSYSATIDWGDGSATSVGTIASLGGASFSVAAPSHVYSKPGAYALTITVNDADPVTAFGSGLVLVSAGVIAVSPAPGGPITTAVEGAPLTGVIVATFTDTNPTAVSGDFAATIDWGDGTPTSAGTVSQPGGPGTAFVVRGTHTYSEEGGPFTITVGVSDGNGGIFTAATLVTAVADATLSAGTPLPISGAENQLLSNVPVATFVDANPNATAADFTASINWGDGSPIASGLVTLVGGSAAGAIFAISGSHTYASAGTFSVTVTALDKGGSSITVTPINPIATISQSPLSVNVLGVVATVGVPTPASKVVATFTDSGGADLLSDYTATIDWGDGTPTSAGSIAALGGGAFSVAAPSHTYAKPGVYALTVTVNDADPAVGIGGGLVVVSAGVLTATPAPGGPITTAVEGNQLTGVIVATFTSSNPAAVAGDFAATIDWGDGSPQTAGLITQPGGPGTAFVITGNHTYADEGGPFLIGVSILDNNGGHAATSTIVTAVADAALTNPTGIPVFSNQALTLNGVLLGTFSDGNPLATQADFAATINWGDGSPTSIGLVHLIGGTATTSTFSVSGTHHYNTSGSFPITVIVLDDGGMSTVINTTANISAGVLSVTVFPIGATEGLPTPAGQIIGTFTDIGAPDPVSNYTVLIDWGDGTPAVTAQVAAVGGGTYNILAPAHVFAEEGNYIVTVTVTDSDGSGPITGASLAIVKDAALTGNVLGPISVVEGAPLNSIIVSSFTDANPAGTVSDFTATIQWGDGTTTAGLVTQPNGPGTAFFVLGTHTFVEEGVYPLSVTIVDEGGSRVTTATTVIVSEAPITVNPVGLSLSGVEGIALTHVEVATFTSGNPFDRASDFLVSINWGDGTPSTAGEVTRDAFGVFHISGSHTYTASGKYTPVISIGEVDDVGALAQTTASVTIAPSPIAITGIPVSAVEGAALANPQNVLNGTVVATFTDNGPADLLSDYTVTIDWGNGQITPGTVLQSGSNFVIVAPASPAIVYADEGTYTIRVTLTDSDGAPGFFQVFAFSTATVKDANLTADPAQPQVNAFQGTPLVGVNVAKFTDANPLGPIDDFSATIDWGDGSPVSAGSIVQPGGVGTAFFVTGNHTYAQPTTPPAAPYTVTVTIHDIGGKKLVTNTLARVTASTITGSPVTINAVESQPISNAVVAYFTDSGIPGPISSYSATIDWGAGAPATFGQIVPMGGNQFAVVGNFTYAEENVAPNLPYAVTVVINHNGTLATTVVSHAQVADAPIIGVAVPAFGVEGKAFTGTVGFFTDTDVNGIASDFSAVINWGDGTSTSGTVVANGAGFLVTAADPVSHLGHIYAEEGTYTYNIVVKDVGGATFTSFALATIADAPLTATAVNSNIPESPAFNAVVATFTDADPAGVPADFTAVINWGDGVTSPGVIAIGPTGLFTVSGTHVFEEGVFFVSVQIKDEGGATAQTVSTITVTDSPLTAGAPITIAALEGRPFSAQVATFSDADLLGVISDFATTIDWGDGTTSAGVIAQTAAGPFTVTGSHTYADESPAGGYKTSVSVKDAGGSTVTVPGVAIVSDAPLSSSGTTIVAVEGATFTSSIAVFGDANPNAPASDFTTTINWGDGSPSETVTSLIQSGTSPSGVNFLVNGTHRYAEEGNYAITVTIIDKGGSQTVAQSLATVADAALVAPTQPVVNVTEGVPFSLGVAAFIDLNGSGVTTDFVATIDWGDGTPRTSGTIVQPGGPGNAFFVVGQHVYVDSLVNGGNGRFNITVNVTDDGGSTITLNNTAFVADVPVILTGNLNPSSDHGASNVDGVTNVNQPNFVGTSEPNSTVVLTATPTGGGAPIYVGQVQTDGSGAWSITSALLPDGSYTVTGRALDKAGYTIGTYVVTEGTAGGPLVIDTVGPKVTDVLFARLSSAVLATLQDDRSGLDNTGVIDASNYAFNRNGFPQGHLLVTALPITSSGGLTAPETVAITINGAKTQLRGGLYTLIVRSNGTDGIRGIRDIAGNSLDGEYYGFFPSGNNKVGGDFVAKLDAIHRRIFAAGTVIGPATPVSPPGRKATGTVLHTIVVPPKVVPLKPASAAKNSAHARAIKSKVIPLTKATVPTASLHDIAIQSIADAGTDQPDGQWHFGQKKLVPVTLADFRK